MSKTICEGKLVLLRPVEAADAERVTAWKRDPLVKRMALGASSEADLSGQQQDIESACGSDDEVYAIVVVAETDRPVGYVRINWMDELHTRAWLRFAMGQERRRGYMRDALRAFLGHLIGDGVHRVDAEAYAFNDASIRLLEGLGFLAEGRKREAHWTGEDYTDVIAFGLLAGDFIPR